MMINGSWLKIEVFSVTCQIMLNPRTKMLTSVLQFEEINQNSVYCDCRMAGFMPLRGR